jgi:hypothetical protein
MNALSPGYSTFAKRFADAVELYLSILRCPYFGGYYSVVLKVIENFCRVV